MARPAGIPDPAGLFRCRGRARGDHSGMADEIPDLADRIAAAAAGPAEVEGDQHRVKEQPIRDLIEADRYGKACRAAGRKAAGLRITKLVPPGA